MSKRPLAERRQLERVHTPEYVRALERVAPAQGLVQLDPDTVMNPYTLNAARRRRRGSVGDDLVVRESRGCILYVRRRDTRGTRPPPWLLPV